MQNLKIYVHDVYTYKLYMNVLHKQKKPGTWENESNCLGFESVGDYFLPKFPLICHSGTFLVLLLLKKFKEDMQQGHPWEVKGNKSREKITEGSAYEIICILLGTKKSVGRKPD